MEIVGKEIDVMIQIDNDDRIQISELIPLIYMAFHIPGFDIPELLYTWPGWYSPGLWNYFEFEWFIFKTFVNSNTNTTTQT